MKRFKREHHMDGLLILLLFGVFAACILMVLLTGADAYSRLAERDDGSYDRRTVSQYVATKLRQSPAADAVSVGDFGGVEAIEINEDVNGAEYVTRIYCFDGYIREIFSAADAEMAPEDGEKILPALGMDISLDGSLLSVEISGEDDRSVTVTLSLRGGEEAAL